MDHLSPGHLGPPAASGRQAGNRVPPKGGAWGRLRGVSFGLGLLVLGVLAPGCGEDEPPPVQAARRFVHAVQAGEVDGVLEMLDAEARAYVVQAAERASDQVGGRRSVEPQEMLQVVDVDPHFQIKEAELVEGDDRRALVRLHGADDTTRALDLVHENGTWLVNLPLPRAPIAEMGESVEP